MTDIDPKSDIELHSVNEHVIVRVPLAGTVTEEWLRCYQRLAHATGVPVQAQAHPDRAWLVVSVPADGNQREVTATMDAARALIAEANAGERAPAAAPAESIVRDWWARRRESAPHRPISKVEVARTGIGTEKRWPLLGALAFSPTDVMPLARWAKAAMAIQAAGSLAILGLVIARAVNILQ
jgi:hypothetical protein